MVLANHMSQYIGLQFDGEIKTAFLANIQGIELLQQGFSPDHFGDTRVAFTTLCWGNWIDLWLPASIHLAIILARWTCLITMVN